jgi:hypothetical protein
MGFRRDVFSQSLAERMKRGMLSQRITSLFGDVAFKVGRRTGLFSTQRFWLKAIQKNWLTIEHFDESWIGRIEAMARFIPVGASVLDLGCGPMWLRELRPDLSYTGVDYTFRGPGSIVADFNKKQFPDKRCDVAFVSGCLEYVRHPQWFIVQVRHRVKRCVLSYCAVDLHGDLPARRRTGWVNDLSIAEIRENFTNQGFSLAVQVELDGNIIFVFDVKDEFRIRTHSGEAL